jgi:uncharacterized protein (TIGR02453 family)
MSSLTPAAFQFMEELSLNNNKAWFDANRKRYEELLAMPLKAMAQTLSGPVASILPEFSGKAKVSRINNDIRFSPNKPLYKEHMWLSFGSGVGENSCADLFCGLGAKGWTAGVGTGSPRREPLEQWRSNLIRFESKWTKFTNALKDSVGFEMHLSNAYSRPLYPEAPDALQPILQAREAWMFIKQRTEFKLDPNEEFYLGLCRMLPIYLFATLPVAILSERLARLGTDVPAPDPSVAKLWKLLK